MDISSALGICLHFILFKVFGLSQEMDLPLIQILLLVLWLLPRPSASYGLSAGFPPTHHCFFLSKFSSISAWMTLSHKFLLACYFSPGSFYGRRGFTSFINLTKFLFYLLFYFWTSTMSHLCIYIYISFPQASNPMAPPSMYSSSISSGHPKYHFLQVSNHVHSPSVSLRVSIGW